MRFYDRRAFFHRRKNANANLRKVGIVSLGLCQFRPQKRLTVSEEVPFVEQEEPTKEEVSGSTPETEAAAAAADLGPGRRKSPIRGQRHHPTVQGDLVVSTVFQIGSEKEVEEDDERNGDSDSHHRLKGSMRRRGQAHAP
ncbi:uncharacterized protein LOC144062795 [Vanacampus margaritifer]